MTDKEILQKIEEYNSNGKKTIAFFCDVFYPSIDGVISVVNNLAKALTAYFNVVVCVPKHKGKTHFMNEYLVLGANALKVPGMDYECSYFPSCDKKFTKFLSALRIDLVHFHSPFFMGKFAAKLAKKRNIPLVATFHSKYKDDFWLSTHSHILTSILLKNVMGVFNKSDLVFTMNEYCENVLKDYGLKKPVKLVGNATNHTQNYDEKKIAEARQIFGISNNIPTLLYVGRLVKVKNLPMTLNVLARLKKRGQKFKFVFVGEGSLMGKLKRMAKKLDLQKEVVFTGKIADKNLLDAIYALADLFVFTSTYDTEGLVIQEAATKATPSVVIECTGSACKIVDNQNGFISKNSVEDYAETIIQALSSKEKLKAIGTQAQKTLPRTWEKTALVYKDMYEKLIKE